MIDLGANKFNLQSCAEEIGRDENKLEKKMLERMSEIQALRKEIRPKSRNNFQLERQITVLDKQIHLLIRHQIQLQDVTTLGDLNKAVAADKCGLLKENRK